MNEEIREPWASAMERRSIGDPRNGRPSYRALAAAAGIGVETARRMALGIGMPKQESLQAVADALRMDVVEVATWVGLAREVGRPYTPPDEAHLLTLEERAAVDQVIRLMAKNRAQAAGGESDLTIGGHRVEVKTSTGSGKSSALLDMFRRPGRQGPDDELPDEAQAAMTGEKESIEEQSP